MLWKEHRALRGFWLGLLALLTLATWWGSALGPDRPGATQYLFALALGATAFYAVGCVAATVGSEFEEGTSHWLQALPVSPARLAAEKVLYVVGSTLAFLACSLLVAGLFSRWRAPSTIDLGQVLSLWGIATLEAITYGFLFAMLIRKPLIAMCVTIGVVGSVIAIFSATAGIQFGSVPSSHLYEASEFPRLLLVALVALLDLWLAPRWLQARVLGGPRRTSRLDRWLSRRRQLRASNPQAVRPPTMTRLLWHSVRQMRWVWLALTLTPMWFLWMFGSEAFWLQQGGLHAFLILVATLLGSVTFLGDQQGRHYLFFGEHGISGRRVWISRQIIPIAVLAVMYILLTVALIFPQFFFSAPYKQLQTDTAWPELFYTLGRIDAVALAFSAGQLCSMLLRSGLLAVSTGVVLATVLVWWAALMSTLGVPHWWSVWPIAMGLFASTLVRAPSWVIDRGGWHGWRAALAVLAAPLVAIALVLPAYRVYSVPNIDPGIDVPAYLSSITPEARETAAMYRRAWELCKYTSNDDPERRAEGIALCIEASQRPSCALFDPRSGDLGQYQFDLARMDELARLVIANGRADDQPMADLSGMVLLRMSYHLREFGLPSAAQQSSLLEQMGIDQLVQWVSQPKQDKRVVMAVLRDLEQLQRQAPPETQLVQSNYVYGLRVLEADARERADLFRSSSPFLAYFFGQLPWERARAKRVLRAEANESLRALARARETIQQKEPVELASGSSVAFWEHTTPLVRSADEIALPRLVALDYALGETRRRAARLQLALTWWRLDRGFEAKGLKRLTPEALQSEPTDPFTGRSFGYLPGGLRVNANMELNHEPGYWTGSTVIPRDTSFVWSPGPNHQAQAWWHMVQAQATYFEHPGTPHILQLGLAFPVGRPK